MFVLFCIQKWSWSFSNLQLEPAGLWAEVALEGSPLIQRLIHTSSSIADVRRQRRTTSSEELRGSPGDTHRDSKAKPQSYFCKGITDVVWNCSTKRENHRPGVSIIYHVRHRSEYISHISVTWVNRYNQSCLLISFQELLFCKIMLFFTTHSGWNTTPLSLDFCVQNNREIHVVIDINYSQEEATVQIF